MSWAGPGPDHRLVDRVEQNGGQNRFHKVGGYAKRGAGSALFDNCADDDRQIAVTG